MNNDIQAAVSEICQAFKEKDVTLFVGAGISIESPSSLPSSIDFKWALFKLYGSDSQNTDQQIREENELLHSYICSEAMELILSDFADCLNDNALEILEVFKLGKPNSYHLLAAKLAKYGMIKRIITTNFDIHLEEALALEGVKYNVFECEYDFAEYQVSPEKFQDFPIFKLHGTIAFTENGKILTERTVEAISELKRDLKLLEKIGSKEGYSTLKIGFDRKIKPEMTAVATLHRIGLALSPLKRQVFEKFLSSSTLLVIGWNGFDLDISPLFNQQGEKIYWIVHKSPGKSAPKPKLASSDEQIQKMIFNMKEAHYSDEIIHLGLLATKNMSFNVQPTPDIERDAILSKRGGKKFEVNTPDLIKALWLHFPNFGEIPIFTNNSPAVKSEISTIMKNWQNANDMLLQRWSVNKFMSKHGEHQSVNSEIKELIEHAKKRGQYAVASSMYLDLAKVNSSFGCRKEAVEYYLEAIDLKQKKCSTDIDLASTLELGYFGLGEVNMDFFDFNAAKNYFLKMPTDQIIKDILSAYCEEKFKTTLNLLEQLRFRENRSSLHHIYLFYFLKRIQADIYSYFSAYEEAARLYEEVLTTSTKVGWAQLQVQALNGLCRIYYAPNNLRDLVKAAEYAFTAFDTAHMAEYRVGKAFACYYASQVYNWAKLNDFASRFIKSAYNIFDKLEHDAGKKICRQASEGSY